MHGLFKHTHSVYQERPYWGPKTIFAQFGCSCSSVPKSCLTLCDPTDCSTPRSPVLHHLPEFAQTHVHWVSDAIQPIHPLSSPPPALNLSQHLGLFQGVGSSHQVTNYWTSASVLPMNIQSWFPLGYTGLSELSRIEAGGEGHNRGRGGWMAPAAQ